MGKYSAFFVWWIEMILIGTLCFWFWTNGVFLIIYQADITHVTQIAGAITLLACLRIGWLSWLFASIHTDHKKYLRTRHLPAFDDLHYHYHRILTKISKHVEEWWTVSDSMMALAIIGTVSGLAYLIYSLFGGMGTTITDPAELVKLLPRAISPLGTIFFTTGCGVAASLIIRVQLAIFVSISGLDDDKYWRR